MRKENMKLLEDYISQFNNNDPYAEKTITTGESKGKKYKKPNKSHKHDEKNGDH